MEMTIDEIIRQLLVAVITIKVMEIADKEVGEDNAIYNTMRPLLVSSLLYSVYKSVKVGYEPGSGVAQ